MVRKPTQKALEPCQGGCRIPRESYEAENFSTTNHNTDSRTNGFTITVESGEPGEGAQNHTEVSRTDRSTATLRIVQELRGDRGGK